jgi:hypothetical protein
MTPLLLALLMVCAQPPADPCADVFDRTAECPAPDDLPLLGAALEEAAPDASVGQAAMPNFAWGFFSGAVVAGLMAGTLNLASLGLTLHLGQLREGGLNVPERADPVLARRQVFDVAALALWASAALLGGTAAAFWVFDPGEGRVREAFVIVE